MKDAFFEPFHLFDERWCDFCELLPRSQNEIWHIASFLRDINEVLKGLEDESFGNLLKLVFYQKFAKSDICNGFSFQNGQVNVDR